MEKWKNLSCIAPELKHYEISTLGNIRHVKFKRNLKFYTVNGYAKIRLYTTLGKKMSYRVNRLVALTFIPNPNNYSDVNHKSFNKLDNSVSNLEWLSHADNIKYNKLKGVI